MIKLTAYYPSKNPNGRVAMLDIQLWIERDEEGYQQLRFSHFEKEMKNKFVIMKDSAYEDSRKRTVLTQEVIRRLRNCHPEISKDEKVDVPYYRA